MRLRVGDILKAIAWVAASLAVARWYAGLDGRDRFAAECLALSAGMAAILGASASLAHRRRRAASDRSS